MELGVRWDGERTRLATLYEAGCGRVRLPRSNGAEAVLINTSGGIADGDRLEQAISVTGGASLTVTTQAAEKVYRARSLEPATIDSRLRLEPDSELHWLPQEMILFDRARLRRSLDIELAGSATLLAAESVVLGRAAHGERLAEGMYEDRWQVRSGGRLIWADRFRLSGDIASLTSQPAVMAGGGAMGTILYVGPEAECWLDPVRGWLAELPARAGVTRRGPLLAVRLIASTGDELRVSVADLLTRWRSGLAGRPVALPRVWRT